jgi:integrase/recombinase XerD
LTFKQSAVGSHNQPNFRNPKSAIRNSFSFRNPPSLQDIDRERMQIRIVRYKGKKDRKTKLSVKFLPVPDDYIGENCPKEYLFEGACGDEYPLLSQQNMIRGVVTKAGIKKHVSVHTLRHTFAIHYRENRVDLRNIQAMMGNESSKSIEIYTHVTTRDFDQVKSPPDSLDY